MQNEAVNGDDGQNVIDRLIMNDFILKTKRPFKTIMGHNANQKYHDENDGVDLNKLNESIELFGINVIIIHGDDDNVLPVGNAYCLNENLFKSKLCILKGEGHWIHATKSGFKQCIAIINDMTSNTERHKVTSKL